MLAGDINAGMLDVSNEEDLYSISLSSDVQPFVETISVSDKNLVKDLGDPLCPKSGLYLCTQGFGGAPNSLYSSHVVTTASI